MFTSQPSLAQAVDRMIQDTPVVDTHARFRPDRPSAPDLAGLLGGHGVPAELLAAGMPATALDPSLPADERVLRAIPFLRRTRNTATSWCLYRIFRDLYDFHDPYLTETNYRDLFDKVSSTGRDPSWASRILRGRCNVQTVVTSLPPLGAGPGAYPDDMVSSLDADSLIHPGPFGPIHEGQYYETLCSLLGDRPSGTDFLTRLLHDWLERTLTGPVRFTRVSLPIGPTLSPPDDSRIGAVLSRLSGGREVRGADNDALSRFVTWQLLAWHHDHRKAIQMTVGPEAGPGQPRSRENWAAELAPTFAHFSHARFDLQAGSPWLAPELAALARLAPNVYVSGYGRSCVVPGTIASIFGHRVHTVPMTKFVGFFSESSCAEWAYGTFQAVKKATATALARLVDSGYYEEDEVPPILLQTLYATPRDLYDLFPLENPPALA